MEAATKVHVPTAETLGAAAILFLIGVLTLAPVPAAIAPYSLVTAMPAFLLASALGEKWFVVGAGLGSLIAPIAYVAASRHISKTGTPMPKTSVIGFAVLALLSLAYAAIGWDTTARYTSVVRATALVAQAVLPVLGIAGAGIAIRSHLTVRRSLVLHWVAFAWLAWGAFPWYGELL